MDDSGRITTEWKRGKIITTNSHCDARISRSHLPVPKDKFLLLHSKGGSYDSSDTAVFLPAELQEILSAYW